MRGRFLTFWVNRRDRIGSRLQNRAKKRYFRCPACRAVQAVPVGRGQTKIVCRRCGEIFLRRT
ncbi:MAG: hypothetical protein IJJ99_02020 [Oscillospiraceae bacterium]|nr:hypothetical protein [Oscillospiraceae bacterium]